MTGQSDPAAADPRRARAGRRRNPFRGRRSLVVAASVAVVVLVGGGVAVVEGAGAASAQSAYSSEYSNLQLRLAKAAPLVDAAGDVVSGARSTLASSEGKVLAEDSRTALSAAIDGATATVAAATAELAEAEAVPGEPNDGGGFLSAGSGLREQASALADLKFPVSMGLEGFSLDGSVAPVVTAVAAWQGEHDRIVAARYTNNVHASGWYPELDQCTGSVDVTAHYAGVPSIAEHWSCGGKQFPTVPGTIVTLTGERAGTYRVEGIVKMVNQHTATTDDLPRGYDLIYQTCQNGQSTTMSFTGLTRLPDNA